MTCNDNRHSDAGCIALPVIEKVGPSAGLTIPRQMVAQWDTKCPRHDGPTSAGTFWSDPDYLGAAAAVSPGGTIRNMKVETFSPGLNGPGIWLLTGFKLWRKAAIAMASSAVSSA